MREQSSGRRSRHWLPAAWPRDTRQWVLLVLLLATVAMLWLAARVLFLFFGAALIALLLNSASGWLHRRTPLSCGWAMAVVLVVLSGAAATTAWLLAPAFEQHLVRLGSELPKAAAELQDRLQRSPLGKELLSAAPNLSSLISGIPKQLAQATSLTLSVLVNIVVVFFVGLYLAINPRRYVNGFARLFPINRRARLREVLDLVGVTLQRWMVGQMILMTSNAMVTALGLWLMGMRLPVTLGLISGLFNFVPNIGPIVAAIPAVLLAFLHSPSMALYVALFYLVYQMLEGYVLTPLVQRQAVELPPALTIMSQVLLGVLFGAIGVLFAVPLVASAIVLVKMLYLQDVLGERVELPSHPLRRTGQGCAGEREWC